MMQYMFGGWGMGGAGVFFWITALLIWSTLVLLIAYLWKLINKK